MNNVAADQDGDYIYTVSGGVATITGYTGAGGDITIPSTLGGYPVVAIGDWAFAYCTALTSVTIPDSVTTIGDYAFYYCVALTSAILGNGVTTIGYAAFYHCAALTSVVIPDGVTSIGDYAFGLCTALTSVTIGNSITAIAVGAFYCCEALASVTIPDSVTSIGSWAFYKCSNLISVSIGNGVTTIGDNAFLFCPALTSVTIGNSVTTIGIVAFAYCTALTSMTFYGLTAPTSVGADWIDSTAPGIQGHAYAASNFPAPGEYFYGLMMGGYIDGPQTAVISFSQDGVGASAPDAVLTVDGSPYLSGQLPVSFTWSIATHHEFSWSSEVYDGSGTRHHWLYSSGLSSAQSDTLFVLADGSIAAFYSTEYLVSFGQSGLGEDATGTVVTVDGLPLTYGDLPYSTWVGDGETIEYSHEAVVSSGTDTDYVLTSVIGPASPITVVGPATIVGSYILGETGPPMEKTSSYVFYAPSDGWWTAQVVNNGLRSIYLTVIDLEYLPGSEPDLAERVNFMKLDCYPVGTAYSSSVYMLAGHEYEISITPYGDGYAQVTDEFTPDTEASSLSVSLLGIIGVSSGVLLFAVVCLGPYLLMRVGKMSSRQLPVPGAAKRTSVKKVRVLRGMTGRDRSS